MASPDWHCPLCSFPGAAVEVKLPYGKSCAEAACPHRTHLNVNGSFYATVTTAPAAVGIGISEIAKGDDE